MTFDQGLADWVTEAMAPVGTVTMRKMMGMATLYFQDRIFAIVDEEVIRFKADAVSPARKFDEVEAKTRFLRTAKLAQNALFC